MSQPPSVAAECGVTAPPEAEAPTRFIMVGGFLGAGKTTALLRLAKIYAARGLRVGIITNDQAANLVDTATFRSAGFQAEEIPHGCFCCKFEELLAAAGRLVDGHRPDVLLAEPVGSCTDLVATVIKPLRRLYEQRFRVAPYTALLDPQRAYEALTATGRAGLSAKITYLYKMQQHEADIVALNKVDTLSADRLAELMALVRQNFPRGELLTLSAKSGAGFDELAARLHVDREAMTSGTKSDAPLPSQTAPSVEIDYDIYAAGEAELGWFNGCLEVQSAVEVDVDGLLVDLLASLRQQLSMRGFEAMHVKILAELAQGGYAVANLVGSRRDPELSRPSAARGIDVRLTINARAACGPEELQSSIERAVGAVVEARRMSAVWRQSDSLQPGRPVPVYRE